MYELYTTKTFERRLKSFIKKHPELEDGFQRSIDTVVNNPFDNKLRTHKLSGELKNEWSIWLTYEYRITFIMEDNKIYLTNIGSHDEIY